MHEVFADGLFRQRAQEQLIHRILENLGLRTFRGLVDDAGQLLYHVVRRHRPLGDFVGFDAQLRLVSFLLQPVGKGALLLHGLEGGEYRLPVRRARFGEHGQIAEAHQRRVWTVQPHPLELLPQHVLHGPPVWFREGMPVDARLQFVEQAFRLPLVERQHVAVQRAGFRVGHRVVGGLGARPCGSLALGRGLARVYPGPGGQVKQVAQAVGLGFGAHHQILPAFGQRESLALNHARLVGVHRLGGFAELRDGGGRQHLAGEFELHVAGQQTQPRRAGVALQVAQLLREVARIGLGAQALAGLQRIAHLADIAQYLRRHAGAVHARRPAGTGVANIWSGFIEPLR